MTTTTQITLADLEQLADRLEADTSDRRERLTRLITAYARIVAQREPERFPRRATRWQDEDGHWDGSFGPDAVYCDRTGPRTLRIVDSTEEWIATESGFYHQSRCVTTDPGLWVGVDGTLYGCTWEGTSRLGQYAACPADCDRDVTIEWDVLDEDEIPLAHLEHAETKLRALAFPLVAAAASI